MRRFLLSGLILTFLTSFSGSAGAVNAEVKDVNGAPAFVFDGIPHCGMSHMTYCSAVGEAGTAALTRYIKSFAGADCDLYTFVTDIGGMYGYSQTIWPEPERWDFSQLDRTANLIIDNAPPNAKLFLQLFIDAPEWWVKANPSESIVLSNGTADFGEKLFALPRKDNFPSMASRKWRADMKMAIEKLIDHVEQSNYGARVAGYQVCGQKTEEWYHWSMNCEELGDYSPHMVAAFRTWLREKYATDAALQKAWNDTVATLDSASIPTKEARYGNRAATFRDPTKEQPVIDFHRFWSDTMADTIAFFAKVVKDKTNRTKVVGGFYAYTFEFADLVEDAGHLALDRLLECPDLDFVMSPSSYYRRMLKGGQSCFRAPVLSLNRHGKMLWNDFDAASFKFYEKDQKALAPWKESMAVTETPEEFPYMIRRELGNALANGVNMVYFDLHGEYYEDPVILAAVKDTRRVRTEALARPRSSTAQVLVVVDEDSQHFLTFRNLISRHLLIEQLVELPFVAPFDAVLMSDLTTTDTTRYKMVIVANVFRMDSTQRLTIEQKLESGGKTVVWLYAPGFFRGDSGASDPAGISDVTGITVAARKRVPGITATFEGPPQEQIPLFDADPFVIVDTSAEILAKRSDTGNEPVVGMKTFDGWTSVYSATAPLPRRFLRGLAKKAGVHIYHDNCEDAVYANSSYLTLASSPNAGNRTIVLPSATMVKDAFTGEVICTGIDRFTTGFRPSEVRVFSLGN